MTALSQEFRRTSHRRPPRLLKGVDAQVNKLIGITRRRGGLLHALRTQAEQVDSIASEFSGLTDHSLRERLWQYRDVFRRGGRGVEGVLVPALAGLREASERQVGLRPFVVQLMGALALHKGCLAEMATGEGKTLTAGLAAILAGWTRRPCHIITVNDYLVERDAAWLRPLHMFAGVTNGCVTGAMAPPERRSGYACEITYVTSKEVVADFLRDRLHAGYFTSSTSRLIRRMLRRPTNVDSQVMRGLHTVIVDEADSVLIDEAVTPLIISSQNKNEALRDVVRQANEIVGDLQPDVDYEANTRYREVELTRTGLAKLDSRCSDLSGIWRGPARRVEVVRQALSAREFFIRNRQYVVTDGKIVIVDEFTGRPMPQRTWRQGMHQAIEAKEGVEISNPTDTLARLSFQKYFRQYHHVSGMTGTAWEAANEFWQIYGLPVVRIPTNRPCVRSQWKDRAFANEDDKWRAIEAEIVRLHATGRPILVGTRSVATSERLGTMLAERGLHARILNAVRHQEEATVIAEAGEPGHITIATNMAGRGTDIKLGTGVAALGGLHVIATERHESGRVDRQLFGRAARQGDPGSAQAFFSAEDELCRRYLPEPVRRSLRKTLQGMGRTGESLARAALRYAQGKAQGLAYQQRKSVLRTDEWQEESLSFAPSAEG